MNARIAKKYIRDYLAGVRANQRRTLRGYVAALTYLHAHEDKPRKRWIPREYPKPARVWIYHGERLPPDAGIVRFEWGPPAVVADSPEIADLVRAVLLRPYAGPVVAQ